MYLHSSFYTIRNFQCTGPCLNYNVVLIMFLSHLEQELQFFLNTVKLGFKGHLNSGGRGVRNI